MTIKHTTHTHTKPHHLKSYKPYNRGSLNIIPTVVRTERDEDILNYDYKLKRYQVTTVQDNRSGVRGQRKNYFL